MFKNYFKIALRNLIRNKFYTILNILGLSIGITAAILITLFVRHELVYDQHYSEHERIFRLESHFNIQGSDDYFAVTAFPLASALKLEYPQIEDFTRFTPMNNNVFMINERKFFEDNVFYADSSVFKLFDHPFLYGDSESALKEPNSIALSESMAKKMFGDKNPLGQSIDTGYGLIFNVTGVFEDVKETSHLKYEALCSLITLANDNLYGKEVFESLDPRMFWNVGHFSYVLLKENSSMDDIMLDYDRFNQKYIEPLGKTLNASFELMYQPLADVHLKSKLGYDKASGNIGYVYIFIVIGIFLLLIGSINYMNLATAQSVGRSVEVGIRKVLGAGKSTIRSQFIVESIIIALISMVLALIIATELLPFFEHLAGMSFSFDFESNYLYLAGLLSLSILIGIISGSYPAFFLASFKPVKVLKGKDLKAGKNLVRKILVLIQFSISIILIVGTFIVGNQLNFIRNRDLGFNQDNLISFTVRDTFAMNNISAFKSELLKHPDIEKIGISSSIPGTGVPIIVHRYETQDGSMVEKAMNFTLVDHEYLDILDIKLLKGRFFEKEMETDSEEAILINEATATALGWGDDAVGKKIEFAAGPDGSATYYTKVIGVYKDFHYESLHNKIDPMLILLWKRPANVMTLKLHSTNLKPALDHIKKTWNEFNTNFPLEYKFMDERMAEFYQAEQKMAQMFTLFAILCIFIACLGLLGLASFTTTQRFKEIGIRKVLGASTLQIVLLLVKEFLIWVLVANLIAWPVAYIAMNDWLDNFAYRIDIVNYLYVFFIAGFIALVIAMATVSYHAFTASRINPAETLKYE